MTSVQFQNEYGSADPWRRSQRGNATRWYVGHRLTIFQRPRESGWFGWCVAWTDGGVQFSASTFASERAAMEDCCRVVNERVG
ncbi:MAG: hypothetical protein L0Y72_18910 [Gemmataceae bacterium]|nr:hypothetical protein [Gemmataceae bacterium]MCI0741120.1 hypothetical protein [Gemmataceae bacterium]